VATRFEWDEDKNRRNVAKYGIGFDAAIGVFADPNSVMRFDRQIDDRTTLANDRLRSRRLSGCPRVHTWAGAEPGNTTADDILILIISRGRRHHSSGGFMKKANGTTNTRELTLEQIRDRKPAKWHLEQVAALAALPDDQIDTSDIPEITAKTGWIRYPLYRPVTRIDDDSTERPGYRGVPVPFEVERNAVPNVH